MLAGPPEVGEIVITPEGGGSSLTTEFTISVPEAKGSYLPLEYRFKYFDAPESYEWAPDYYVVLLQPFSSSNTLKTVLPTYYNYDYQN